MIDLQDIVGQDEAVERLRRNISAGRIPHAFCFAGPGGVGRRTTALAFARVLLCENPRQDAQDGPLACGLCPGCTMLAAGSHPDFQLVYKELARYHEEAKVRGRVMQDLGIDVIRSFLIAPAGRSATRGRGKVFVVLEAELLSIAAQNALLKTLEEPPEGVRIILICIRPEQLLPTTRSRCSLVRFGPLPADFVIQKLTEAGIAPAEAQFWSAFTAGALGRALKLSAAGLYEIKRDMLDSLAALGGGGDAKFGEDLTKTSDKLAVAAVREAMSSTGASLSKNLAIRRSAGAMLELIASAFRDALGQASGSGRPMINADQRQGVEAIAGRFKPTELADILEQLSRYERLLWRNVNPKIVWDNAVITCASAAPMEL